jgi:hypothetical protein
MEFLFLITESLWHSEEDSACLSFVFFEFLVSFVKVNYGKEFYWLGVELQNILYALLL